MRMKKHPLYLAIALLCFADSTSYAQLVVDNAFLKGNWLQACIAPNGSFGNTITVPGGYTTRAGASTFYVDPITGTTPTGNGLDFSYDQGHDGFGVGVPNAFYGSYFLPGTPFSGWQVEIDDTMSSAFYSSSGFDNTEGGKLAGTVTKYTGPTCVNPNAPAAGTWEGTYGLKRFGLTNALRLEIVNEVDQWASWMNVTAKFYNTTDSTLKGVYYFVDADPDNDYPISFNFATNNHIPYQGGALDRHEVWARATTAGLNDLFSGLATQDCRAKSLIYQGWPPAMTPANNLNHVYAGTGTTVIGTMGSCYYGLGATTFSQDIAFGLVFNVGNIAPHDSAFITYGWIFSDTDAVDSLYKLIPQLSTEGKQYYSGQKDTVLACTMSGCQVYGDTAFEAEIINGENRDWALSTWTWSPSIGLSTTLGRKVYVDIHKLGGAVTYTITGTPSNHGNPCFSPAPLQFTMYVRPCHSAWANDPCYGGTLLLGEDGDSLGATYKWYHLKYGGTPFSTTHRPIKYPALYTDTGMYYVIKSKGPLSDTDSVRVTIHEKPKIIVTNNAPMCYLATDTLRSSVTPLIPGETFAWTGPNGFTSSLQFPVNNNFMTADTGMYTVIATTPFGCKDTGKVHAGLVMVPSAPVITGPIVYCQYEPHPAYVATDTSHPLNGSLYTWYTTVSGGIGHASDSVYTDYPGTQLVVATVTNSFGCVSPVGTYTVTVNPKPPIPGVTGGTLSYCQYIGPFVPVTITNYTYNGITAVTHWWKTFKKGTPMLTQPIVPIDTAGTYTFYVSQNLNGCESDSAIVTIIVHPKPNAPKIKSDSICQFWPAGPMTATPSIPGDLIRWFIAPDTIGNIVAPVPVTLVPGLYEFFANELSPFGCLSDKGKGTMFVKPKPAPPIPHDTVYCQFTKAPALTADSVYGGYLKWYYQGNLLPHAPVPANTKPGDSTWFVSEVINGCESDSLPSKVTVIYKPLFSIEPSSPFVCQFDSVKFSYKGPSLFDPAYAWSIPQKAVFAHGPEGEMKTATDSFIYVRFDSVTADNYIRLHVTNNHGFCAGDTSYRIKIVPQPLGKALTKGDVCQGDTVALALGSKSASASKFLWIVDNVPMDQTNALSIVAHNSNSGGPFSISWNDSGRHVIQVISSTDEGCTSLPTEDTISVHTSPDARFTYMSPKGTLCLEDSVQFTAMADNYNYSYVWAPEHFFANVNKRQIYGKVELSQSTVTLLVTDPYGCSATTSQTLNPGSCCTVGFPTAFLPNGGSKNNVFRPVYQGYHRFSIFRIANRWGQTVFESTNNGMAWDGTFNGVPQDAGVYFFYIKYDCGGKSLEQTGNVTLIR
ncbi:MAG: hypothetical protein JWQ38_2801 [Flavipsychrobacter sp.]|nr:hypothetical protein [Flavipsychrobacter sp.]